MTITHDTMTVETVLHAVRQLAPTIFDRAGEIEAGRRVPVDLLDSLRAAGCFRLIRPATHGGLEASVADAMRTLESLARADASVAWTVMIGAGSWIDLAHLPRQTFDALYATNPDAITAGVFNPTGSSPAPWRIPSHRSLELRQRVLNTPTCSSETASKALSTEFRTSVEQSSLYRRPDRGYLVGVRPLWHGKPPLQRHRPVVPAERTYAPMNGEPCVDALIVHLPPPAVFSLVMASVALGIAQGALDDITVLATNKMPLLSPVALGGNPLFQFQLATADTDVRAARSLLYGEAARLWAAAAYGDPLTMEDRAKARASAVWTVERATSVVTAAYRAGGGTSLYSDCPLQRRLRHPRPHPALHRPPRHARYGGRDSRRAGRPTHGLLMSKHEAHV